jgi:hypothetical protein
VRIWLYAPLADRRKFSGGLTALVHARLAENPLRSGLGLPGQ